MGVLLDKSIIPDDLKLNETLGKSFDLWVELKNVVKNEIGVVSEEWKFYSAKSGWTMKLIYKKKNLFFFSPYKNYFLISFVFGKKGEEQVLNSGVDERIKTDLSNAVKYVEGKGVAIEVRTKKNIKDILEMVKIKISA